MSSENSPLNLCTITQSANCGVKYPQHVTNDKICFESILASIQGKPDLVNPNGQSSVDEDIAGDLVKKPGTLPDSNVILPTFSPSQRLQFPAMLIPPTSAAFALNPFLAGCTLSSLQPPISSLAPPGAAGLPVPKQSGSATKQPPKRESTNFPEFECSSSTTCSGTVLPSFKSIVESSRMARESHMPDTTSSITPLSPQSSETSTVSEKSDASCTDPIKKSVLQLMLEEKRERSENRKRIEAAKRKITDTSITTTAGSADEADYGEKRKKNNEAAKKSRDLRRKKEELMALRTAYLEQQNQALVIENEMIKSELARAHKLIESARLTFGRSSDDG